MECAAVGRSFNVDSRGREEFWTVEGDSGGEEQCVWDAGVEREGCRWWKSGAAGEACREAEAGGGGGGDLKKKNVDILNFMK